MVFYTDSNGRIFFGQPSTYKDFITRVDVAFDKLLSAASIPAMQATEEVTAGTTYVLKTNGAKKNSPIFYVKLQVLSIN